MRWIFPVKSVPGIPTGNHPGAFGYRRKNYFHTGVDLYAFNDLNVYAVETGTIVHMGMFTGPELGHSNWNETHAIMIEGDAGVVNYGEIKPLTDLRVGDKIYAGECIGEIAPVLNEMKKDIPGHSRYMLHLELYKHGSRAFSDVRLEQSLEESVFLDPTLYLIEAFEAPQIYGIQKNFT